MRVTSKGQVTIPKSVRSALGIDMETDLEFELRDDGALLRVVRSSRGLDAVERLRLAGKASWCGPSTDEVMEMTRGRD